MQLSNKKLLPDMSHRSKSLGAYSVNRYLSQKFFLSDFVGSNFCDLKEKVCEVGTCQGSKKRPAV